MGVDEKALGQRLQKARQRAGLTQQELCQKAGLSYSTLAKIERGAIRSPSVFTVAAISSATDTTIERLLDMKQPGSPALPAKKISKTGVRFVYFDVNGVLLHNCQRAFTRLAEASNHPVDHIEALYWRYNDAVSCGEMPLADFNATLGAQLEIADFDWQTYYLDNAEPVSGVKELIDWVAEHYELGLISNNMPGFIDGLRQKGIIPNAGYKAVIDSSRVGALKPNPKIYEIASREAGLEPKETLFIDDTRANLTAADRAGWQVVWFNELEPDDSIERVRKYLEF